MKYREIKSDGYLSNFIKCFWEYENSERVEHCILPDGYFDLITEYEDGFLTTLKLTGVWTKPINVSLPQSTRIFAIRFKLIAAEYLLRQEIKSILDKTQLLPTNFWGIDTLKSSSLEQFASTLSNQMSLSLKHLKKIDERKINLFRHIYDDKIFSVNQLSTVTFWNSRQMNRYFDKQFGFPLKTFINIVRCNETYTDIANGILYATTEYTDQSHYIKEIRRYTGATPTELAENKKDRFLQLAAVSNK